MIFHGDCLGALKTMGSDSVDSVVTDPPYGLKFMGKKWDYDVPSKDVWTEVLRVLKPGGHLLSFGGTRTYHRMVVAIEDAGFEIRDQIQWLYGSGFPKSHNLSGDHEGWGTALKPANEPIVLARRPLEKGLTVAQNVMKWGCGALNIDASRIGTQNTKSKHASNANQKKTMGAFNEWDGSYREVTQGRWPANVLLDETAAEMLGEPSRFFYVAKASKSERNAGFEGMPEKCTGQRIKAQSAGRTDAGQQQSSFPQSNHHPTVKPIKLMQYLIKLVTPPTGIVLDPFMGSGSTGVAAHNLGFGFIGCEMNDEYIEIAKKRIGV